MAKARPIPDLMAEEPYASAAAKIVAVRAREVSEHSHDVVDVSDIERVHDMRVATRRLRAALEIFEPCLPRKEYAAALGEVKALADALGERRDRDVTLAALEDFVSAIAAPDRPGIETLIEGLRAEQREANEALDSSVTPERLAGLNELVSELVASAKGVAGPQV